MPKVPEKVETVEMASAGRAMPDGFWHAPDGSAVLYHGNCVDQLKRLPARSVHCTISSPPYWGLRDYGTAEWEGGDETCGHVRDFTPRTERGEQLRGMGIGSQLARELGTMSYKGVCGKCGAKRIDMQIGAEPLPDCGTHGQAQCGECFVCSMVAVFREVRRVLRDDGTCWLNLGDTYGEGGQLQMVPARVALALQADGWVLRQDIIWYAPNKMPESVTNRCTKSHEHIFLLIKSEDYYFDSQAIKEETVSKVRDKEKLNCESAVETKERGFGSHFGTYEDGKNKRDVWVVPTRGYAGAHFAVYSPQLITPCILAGTSEHGCCSKCGAPYERVVDKSGAVKSEPEDETRDHSMQRNRNGIGGSLDGTPATRTTAGWRPTCHCNAEVEPCVVLDPFVGSGTTVATAIQYGRRGVGIDLSEKYLLENAIPRIEAAISGEKVKKKEVPVLVDRSPPPKVKVLSVGAKS